MTPLKIWEPKEGKPPEELQMCLRLIPNRLNEVAVAIVDEDGEELEDGHIFYIDTKTRVVARAEEMNRKLGFDLDSEGRVKLDE